jgi:hypothetical protein
MTGRMREALAGLMDIDHYAWNERGAITLQGRLVGPPQAVYRAIRSRLETLGFTPFLRRAAERDELLAVPGVIEHRPPRMLLPAVLFALTFVSVLLTGSLGERAIQAQTEAEAIRLIVLRLFDIPALLTGLPFAAALLGILGAHEMGHYVVGRLRHAPVSLPYFIPLPPPISFIGTMGAVIVQREPMQDRRTVLEVGIAGPLAGLVVAIPLLFYGLATSSVGPTPAEWVQQGYIQEGNSLFYLAAKLLVFGQMLPSNGIDVHLNSVAMAAWIGLLVTMLNLLPVGQLDGGHVTFALLGPRAVYLAYVIIGLCVLMGVVFTYFWLVWAGLAFFIVGPRHPAPLDDISGIGRWHKALAIFGLIVFALLLTPAPLTIVGGS